MLDLRWSALELHNTLTADPSTSRLAAPKDHVGAAVTLYEPQVHSHGQVTCPTIGQHVPARLVHLGDGLSTSTPLFGWPAFVFPEAHADRCSIYVLFPQDRTGLIHGVFDG